MNVRWLSGGREVSPGLEEARVEIDWSPSAIPMTALFSGASPVTVADAEEREWLLRETSVAVRELSADAATRRAVVLNEFPSGLRVNCLCLLHFTIRDDRLDLYAYARSTEVRRLGYDLTTIDLVYRNVRERLRLVGCAVESGTVTAHLHSLHYYVDEKEALSRC